MATNDAKAGFTCLPGAEFIRSGKNLLIVPLLFLTLLQPAEAAVSDSFEDETTPIEQEDMKTIDQINGDTRFEDETTPVEQDDFETIDQINRATDFEDEATPIEQEDVKTLDQIGR